MIPAILQLIGTVPLVLLTVWQVGFDVLRILLLFVVVQAEAGELNDRGIAAVGLFAIRIVFGVGWIIAQAMIIMGSVKQIQQRDYDACLRAAWLSAVFCFTPCAFPFGIWSLIVLYQDSVRRSFRR